MNSDVQRITLNLPASAEYVDIVRLNLYGIASKMGFSYEEIEDMKVAVSEACNNSVLYAYSQEGGMVEVLFQVTGESLSITVRDEGESFDSVGAVGDRTLHDKDLSEVQIGGLGFYLMEALMDEVSVTNQAGKGTEVTLTKRLARSEEPV
ncbi:anti-sigma B factor RsbW [Paenibacillus sp. FSL H8-0457]|uniref:anti-sigma B factor RsbW n=1 Tax=Bacillales TaxID=1385 RepID=UPI0001788202|nr:MULTISPECIES: anti-sigma B factor RsbW [Paenibacillus]ACX67759.1 putative anti-sigma regulatory factor, serine/threonine protein kinase [Paenibacillus sp. Y412MC10]MCM3261862.1 anti-sigma B factor RsbW [Paenibacillus lautus]PCL89872.1 anti-sigma B factor RsbW [Paenibacillus lautus]QOT10119.1 anti-sigma B factor RsbW [Paenibacillus sp. JNUCC-32]WFB57864.1 anti-sigma B factor RsbW [Paenibacillus sp. BR1-192]